MRTANTFVVCRGRKVVGYYSLANGAVAHATTSAKVRRNTPDPIPATVLARLAVATAEKGQGLGRDLLIDASRRILAAAKHSAARLVIVHPLNDGAAAFYVKFGFRPLGADTTALYLPLATLADGL
jgi:predicted N-acetyltransferase YhbS